jgi:6-phosphogluconate dehydrogenase
MVHNGIEYAVMQFLAEAYFLMKSWEMENEEIGYTFEKWNAGKLASFLTELSAVIVRKKEGDGFLIDKILDSAGQKGTGRWTAIDATDRGVAVPTIISAVNARIFSSQKKLREELAGQLSGVSRQKDEVFESVKIPLSSPFAHCVPTLPVRQVAMLLAHSKTWQKGEKIQSLENAVYLAMICAYSEGFWLIAKAAEEQEWDIDFAELARIWQGGCIIRAELLRFLESSFRNSKSQKALFLLPEIISETEKNLPSLQDIVASASAEGIPVPGLSSALQHILQIATARGSANFIQGLRDAFGAHTFQRIDKEGTFHSEWGGDE